MSTSEMFPRHPITDAPYRSKRDVVSLGYACQCFARFAPRSDCRYISFGQFGGFLLTASFSALRMSAGAVRVSSGQPAGHSARRVFVTKAKALLCRCVPNVLPLRAQPKMRRIAAG